MDDKKAKRPQGLSLGLGLVFGAVMYVLTREVFWIPVGIALGCRKGNAGTKVNRTLQLLLV